MAIVIKTPEEIVKARKAGHLAAQVLDAVTRAIRPGISTLELDTFAAETMELLGVRSAFLGYYGYPGQTCISINDTVIHGIPSDRRILDGDIVSVDVGVWSDGFVGDNAKTVAVGNVGDEVQRLLDGTRECLAAGIEAARAGNRLGDICNAVERVAKREHFGIVRDYVGHGCGRKMHEDPAIPNYGHAGTGPFLKPGMVLCIEPMMNLGKAAVRVLADEWTVVTRDGTPSAHFEHMILITPEGPAEILTPR